MLMTDIQSLLREPSVKAILDDFATAHMSRESADEFLDRFGAMTRATGRFGNAAGRFLGVRNTTHKSFSLSHPPALVCIAAICAMSSTGLYVLVISDENDDGSFSIKGDVPSTRLHYEGEIIISVTPGGTESKVDLTIIIPGQVFVWGAGKRLNEDVQGEMTRAAYRLAELPSLSNAIGAQTKTRLEQPDRRQA